MGVMVYYFHVLTKPSLQSAPPTVILRVKIKIRACAKYIVHQPFLTYDSMPVGGSFWDFN